VFKRDGLIPHIDLDETNEITQKESNENIVKLLLSDKFNYTAELEKRYLEYINAENDQDMTCWVNISL
jgi:hypothetical protein